MMHGRKNIKRLKKSGLHDPEMDKLCSSELSVIIFQLTWGKIQEDLNLYENFCDNPTSHIQV